MPRGRKKLTPQSLEERIAEIDVAVESKKAELAELRALRKELTLKKQQTEMNVLYEAVKQSGKSPAELLELVRG